MKFVIQLLIILLNSAYLTQIINQYTIKSKLQYSFVFIYLAILISIIFYFCDKYLFFQQKINTDLLRKRVIISIIISILLVCAGNDFFQYKQSSVEITALGSKNSNSKGTEVWITEIKLDGTDMDLKSIQNTENWELREGALLNNKNQPSSIDIKFQTAKDIKINFLKHGWSGEVLIKEGDIERKIDLYDFKGSDYTYQNTSNYSKMSAIMVWNYFLAIILLASIIYLLLGVLNIKSLVFPYIYILYFLMILTIKKNSLDLDGISTALLIIIGFVCGNIFYKLFSNGKWKNYIHGKFSGITFICITILISFSLLYNPVFYETGKFEITIGNICYFILICLWIVPLELIFIHLMEIYRKKI